MPKPALVHAPETGTFSGSRNNSFIGKLVLYDLWAGKPRVYSYITSHQSTVACTAHPSTCTPVLAQTNALPYSFSAVVTGRSHTGLEGTGEPPVPDCPSSEELPPPRGHSKNCSARRRQLLFLPNFSIPLPLAHTRQDRDGFLPAKSLALNSISFVTLQAVPPTREMPGEKNVRVKAGI